MREARRRRAVAILVTRLRAPVFYRHLSFPHGGGAREIDERIEKSDRERRCGTLFEGKTHLRAKGVNNIPARPARRVTEQIRVTKDVSTDEGRSQTSILLSIE